MNKKRVNLRLKSNFKEPLVVFEVVVEPRSNTTGESLRESTKPVLYFSNCRRERRGRATSNIYDAITE
jgi:hypothetical protein